MTSHCLTPAQLWTYVQQPHWRGAMPCSRLRAWSFLHNPRMREDDIVAVLAVKDEEVVGYRLLLPDLTYGIRFAWLSGVWVNPAVRRQGIATRLLSVAAEAWQDRLVLTNFVRASGGVARKGGLVLYADIPGMRYYVRGDLAERLGNRLPRGLRPLGTGLDFMINQVQGQLHQTWTKPTLPAFPEITHLTPAHSEFMASIQPHELTQRDLPAWQHLLSFPWVEEWKADTVADPFHFTTYAKQHRRTLVGLEKDGLQGMLLAMITNGDARLAYQYVPPEHMQVFHTWLAQWLIQQRAASFTTFQPAWIHALNQTKRLWWTRKAQQRQFLTTPSFLRQLPDPSLLSIQDGEGDRGFV